jgi:DNA mismatch endonuclease, patch repair protein
LRTGIKGVCPHASLDYLGDIGHKITRIMDTALVTERSTTETDPARSALMSKIRRERTRQEDEVARLCRILGLNFRRNVQSLPGSPDLANNRRKWAVFVNGCYWHHHTNCDRGSIPVRNRNFWQAKFSLNRRRDAKNIRILRRRGYRVLIVWQCQLRDKLAVTARLSRLPKSSELNWPFPET